MSSLDLTRLGDLLGRTERIGPLRWHQQVGSTNDTLRELARQGAEAGTVVLAGEQTAGRGRRGRSWLSLPGRGLYLSVLVRPASTDAPVSRWTLAAAVAACAACRELSGTGVEIRWPNDLYYRGRKLAGILTEGRSARGPAELVIGAGFNVSHQEHEFPPDLAHRATSLALVGSCGAPRHEELAAAYLGRLDTVLTQLDEGAWPAIAACWEQLAPAASGETVEVHPPAGDGASWTGQTCGIDDSGALQVRRVDGAVIAVHAAGSVRLAREKNTGGASCC